MKRFLVVGGPGLGHPDILEMALGLALPVSIANECPATTVEQKSAQVTQ